MRMTLGRRFTFASVCLADTVSEELLVRLLTGLGLFRGRPCKWGLLFPGARSGLAASCCHTGSCRRRVFLLAGAPRAGNEVPGCLWPGGQVWSRCGDRDEEIRTTWLRPKNV